MKKVSSTDWSFCVPLYDAFSKERCCIDGLRLESIFSLRICYINYSVDQIWPERIVEGFDKCKANKELIGYDGNSFFRSIIDSCSRLLSSDGTYNLLLLFHNFIA